MIDNKRKPVIYQNIKILIALITFISAVGVAYQPLKVYAETVLAWPSISLQSVVVGLQSPIHLTHSGDSSGRLFIVEQDGRVQIIQNGSLLTTPFLDISGRVSSPSSGGGNEEGLLSIAFPSDFVGKKYFYVFYTQSDGNNVISRFYLTSDPNLADPNSEVPILFLEHPVNENHNGGQLSFGLDGYLYIGTGDGGEGGDPDLNGQDPASLLGKMLRIDVDFGLSEPIATDYTVYLPLVNSPGPSKYYRIPPDNPYFGQQGYREEIWALGLRNPWRFSFDRLNGDLFIGDVGQNNWEEINYQPESSSGGENYGWNIMEGNHCYNSSSCDQSGLILPIIEYSHSSGCSITGGFMYRGVTYPGWQGTYFYGDYCTGSIWGSQESGEEWISQELLDTDYNITSFGEDQDGELYLLDRDGGLFKIVETP
jgi:glucose/arabinose dehydrogenase